MATVNFNKEYANQVKKDRWVKEHNHLAEHVDLAAEWESLQEKKVKYAVPVKAVVKKVPKK